MAPLVAPQYVAVVEEFAWFLWGSIFQSILTGVTLMQLWYYMRNNRDHWFLQTFIMFLAALDVTTSFLTSAATQHYFVDNYGNPAEIISMPPAFTTESTLTVFIAFFAQQFFAYQLFSLNKRSSMMTTLVSIICITSLAAFAIGVAYTALVFIEKNELNLAVGRIHVLIGTSQALDVVCDLTATIAMIGALWHYRSGLPRTKAMVDKLLVYVVNRGVLITVCQTLFCVLFLVFPLKVVWVFFHMQMSKLYVNTALANLNARDQIRGPQSASALNSSNVGSNVPINMNRVAYSSNGRTFADDKSTMRPGMMHSSGADTVIQVVSEQQKYDDTTKPVYF